MITTMSKTTFAESQARPTGILLAAVTAIISGVAVFVNGYGVRAWADVSDATTYTTFKNIVAAMILGVMLLATRGRSVRGFDRALIREHGWSLALIALVGGSIPFVLFFEGLARSGSSEAAFIHKTLVVWVAVLAVGLLRERVGIPHLAALALLVWGQAVLAGGVGWAAFGSGEWMILLATMLWAIETVIAKRVLGSVPSLTLGIARMAGGAVLLVVYGLVRGALVDLTGVRFEHVVWILLTGATLSVYVATWYAALARAQAVDVTAVLVAGAIITGILEYGVRDAVFPPVTGLGLIALGVSLMGVAGWRRPSLDR